MVKYFIALIVLIEIISYQFAIAQRQGKERVDSLLNELPKAKEDTNKVKLLILISYEFYSKNPDKGIKYAEMALKESENLNWIKGIANSYNIYGICEAVKSNYPIALEYFLKTLNIYEQLNSKKDIAAVLGHIGIVYSEQDDYKKTLEYYNKALKIYEELGDKSGLGRNLSNIGNVYAKQFNYSKALEYYFKAQKYHEELNFKVGIAMNYGNIGNAYRFLSDYENALEYYLKALKISEETNDKFSLVMNLGNIGGMYVSLAKDSVFNNINKENQYISFNKKNNLNRGINYSLKAVELSKEIGALNMLSQWYSDLYEGYKLIGNFEKALEYHELYKINQDSMFNQEKAIKFANLESKRETQLREKEIEGLNNEKKFQKVIQYYLIGISLLAFIISLLILFGYIRKKKDNKLLNEKNATITEANIELDYLNSSLSSQNRELSLLYQELQNSEAKYKNIFENSTIGIYRTTPDGKVLSANPALINILKFDSFEELSKLNLDVEQPNQNYSRQEFKKQIQKEGKMIGLEGIWLAKDGTEIYIRESVNLVKDEDGNPLYYDGVAEDITEKRKSELALIASEKKLKESYSAIEKEKDKSEKLLLNVLPESIAIRLKEGETSIADHFEEASVIFIDIVDFTILSAKSTPQAMVKMLNYIFTLFDKIAAKYGLEKIKTIGDCYMAVAGIPTPREDHASAIALMALEVMELMKDYNLTEMGVGNVELGENNSRNSISNLQIPDPQGIKLRIGLNCGPIVAGVIGEQKFIYDVWGDTVNAASRMESNGVVGKIQVTESFKDVLNKSETGKLIKFEERGLIEIKGKGMMRTFFLEKQNLE